MCLLLVLCTDAYMCYQCVLGTLIDAYFRGYDCILLEDATATTSPDGAFEAVIYNAANVSCLFESLLWRFTEPSPPTFLELRVCH